MQWRPDRMDSGHDVVGNPLICKRSQLADFLPFMSEIECTRAAALGRANARFDDGTLLDALRRRVAVRRPPIC